ncbi:hypothetical protein [Kitasatospora sp. NPDC093806]|uniref:hypothetical protein n=1 Tax=Kitasatospora sp. NPDC093806 TaxID=3155075 RepID=UPI0034193DFD
MLYDNDWSLDMYVDLGAAKDLAVAWALAARSRRSLVYVPLRANAAGPAGLGERRGAALDLVLAHHSLGFPPSRWKAVRSRLGAGELHTAEIPESDFPGEDEIDHERRGFEGWRDELRFGFAAETLFLTGSATAFRISGAAVHSLIADGPAHVLAAYSWSHECITLRHGGDGHARSPKDRPGMVHVEYSHGWKVGEG